MAAARMKLLRNRREAQVRKMRGDVAALLRDGRDDTARIRVRTRPPISSRLHVFRSHSHAAVVRRRRH